MGINKRVHNLLMSEREAKPLYEFRKDGVYIMYGPWATRNLVKLYKVNSDSVSDYLYSILENEECPYKVRVNTKDVILYLKENYNY